MPQEEIYTKRSSLKDPGACYISTEWRAIWDSLSGNSADIPGRSLLLTLKQLELATVGKVSAYCQQCVLTVSREDLFQFVNGQQRI